MPELTLVKPRTKDDQLSIVKAAVDKAYLQQHWRPPHRDQAIRTAKRLMALPDFLILDTETTGIEDDDEVIQIAIVNKAGQTVFESLIKPQFKTRWDDAYHIHSISPAKVKNSPLLVQAWSEISSLLAKATDLVIYNADYDWRLIHQSQIAPTQTAEFRNRTTCMMQAYSALAGEWWEWKQDYKWQKLPGRRQHSAADDCMAVLALIQAMAELPLDPAYESLPEIKDRVKDSTGGILHRIWQLFIGGHN